MHYFDVAGIMAKIKLSHGFDLGENYRLYCSFPFTGNYDILISSNSSPSCFDTERLSFQKGAFIGNKFLLRRSGYIFKRKQEALIARKYFTNCRFWHASPDYLTLSNPYLDECTWPMLAVWGYLATHGTGALLHGSLVKLDNKYVLFLGESGAGKSTLSKLATTAGAVCFTDENPFLRSRDGSPWVYGSPWYSDTGLIPRVALSPKETSGQLAAIFFLHHASCNRVERFTASKAAFALIKNCRMFHWLPDTIPDTISLLDIVVNTTPVYSFGFLPDCRAVNFLRDILEQQNE